jgi:hypothetical protein
MAGSVTLRVTVRPVWGLRAKGPVRCLKRRFTEVMASAAELDPDIGSEASENAEVIGTLVTQGKAIYFQNLLQV